MSIKLKPHVCIAWLPFGRIHLKSLIYATVIPVFRQSVKVSGDTLRTLNASISSHADTLRDIRIVKKITVTSDTERRIGRCESALVDTNSCQTITHRCRHENRDSAYTDLCRVQGAGNSLLLCDTWRTQSLG